MSKVDVGFLVFMVLFLLNILRLELKSDKRLKEILERRSKLPK